MESKIPVSFTGAVVGLEKINNQISKGRLRLFYAGRNRNGSILSESFIENVLLKTLPYAPVVGIYDEEIQDFLGHSIDPNEARIYGLVPENPAVSKELHLDEDGVEREYYVCDVYLYTGRLEAANKIVGKAHSMELDPATIRGRWVMQNGEPLFDYEYAEFLGLSVLGQVTPCFEGSAFYELVTQFGLFMEEKHIGGTTMEEQGIKVSSEPEAVFEEGGEGTAAPEAPAAETQSAEIEAPQSESETEPEQQEETEQGGAEPETEEVEAEVIVVEMSKEEHEAYLSIVDNVTLKEFLEEHESTAASLEAAISDVEEKNQKIVESQERISTLEAEAGELTKKIEALTEENESFKTEKKEKEAKEKTALIKKYAKWIPASVLESINPDDYSVEDLKKELLVAAEPALTDENKENFTPITLAKTGSEDGVLALLRKRKEKNI